MRNLPSSASKFKLRPHSSAEQAKADWEMGRFNAVPELGRPATHLPAEAAAS
jgi:hypothetical protein